jgi:hypothetical protein
VFAKWRCIYKNLRWPLFLCVSIFIHYTSRYLDVAVCWSHHVVLCPAGKNPLDRQHVVVCYVAWWAHRKQGLGKFTVDNVDPTLCTHLVFAFAFLNMTSNASESTEPAYGLRENNGTGWCMRSAVRIVSRVNLSQYRKCIEELLIVLQCLGSTGHRAFCLFDCVWCSDLLWQFQYSLKYWMLA